MPLILMRDSVTPRKAHSIISVVGCAVWRSRLPWIDAFECGACLLQMASRDELHQHQHAQRDAQQADQRDDALVVPQKQRRQRQRAPFQPPKALFNQVLATIRGDALVKTHLLGGVVGCVDAPAQALHGVGEWCLLAHRIARARVHCAPLSPGACHIDA